MSLRNILFSVIGALTLMLLAVAAMTAAEAWHDKGIADDVVASGELNERLLSGAMHLVKERDATYLALRTDGSAAVDAPTDRLAYEAPAGTDDKGRPLDWVLVLLTT